VLYGGLCCAVTVHQTPQYSIQSRRSRERNKAHVETIITIITINVIMLSAPFVMAVVVSKGENPPPSLAPSLHSIVPFCTPILQGFPKSGEIHVSTSVRPTVVRLKEMLRVISKVTGAYRSSPLRSGLSSLSFSCNKCSCGTREEAGRIREESLA
jgi:hypothetical protein